jgi:hypothetical protein
MSAKMVFPSALLLAVLNCCAVHAQSPPAATSAPENISPVLFSDQEQTPTGETVSQSMPATPQTPQTPQTPPGLSHWITYACPDCCGPIGGNGPIKEELYVGSGPSFPLGQSIFGHVMQTGWEVKGGARSLFFPTNDMDSAWTADVGISSIWNMGQHYDRHFPLNVLAQTGQLVAGTTNPEVFHAPVQGTFHQMNRTSVDLGLGHEWYLVGNANSCACGERNWRVGLDAGASYGTASASVAIDTVPGIPAVADDGTTSAIHLLTRRTHTIAGSFLGLHTDLEFPCGCCVYMIGCRLEWGYTWTGLLQQNDAEIMELNFLVNCGVRF